MQKYNVTTKVEITAITGDARYILEKHKGCLRLTSEVANGDGWEDYDAMTINLDAVEDLAAALLQFSKESE